MCRSKKSNKIWFFYFQFIYFKSKVVQIWTKFFISLVIFKKHKKYRPHFRNVKTRVILKLSIKNSIYKIGWGLNAAKYLKIKDDVSQLSCFAGHPVLFSKFPCCPSTSLLSPDTRKNFLKWDFWFINRTQGGLDFIKTISEKPEIQGALRLSFQTHLELINHGQP